MKSLKPKIKSKSDFEKLFKQHYANLCSYANHFLKDLSASEDTVQDVLFKIWENKDSIEITSSLDSYLFRAVRNKCLNIERHKNYQNVFASQNQKSFEDEGHNLEESFIASELEQKIRQSIEDMPHQRRKIFILSRYEGFVAWRDILYTNKFRKKY